MTLSDPTLDRLFPELHGFGVKWGLEKTRTLLRTAGDPHLRYDVIHVAGTNGKGSVSAMIASALRVRGHRVGLYTSPHLTRFNERFQVDGVPLTDDALVGAADLIRPSVQEVEPTFFEATTAVGLTAFARAEVDVAVVEVGLGGRLDSTNVVQPVVCALTNVGMDHMRFLGYELTQIAAEKAGIAKPGVPLITTVTDPTLLEVIRARAVEVGAPLTVVPRSEAVNVRLATDHTVVALVPEEGGAAVDFRCPLPGPHQVSNALLAVRVLEALPSRLRPSVRDIQQGLAHTHWPGRLERRSLAGREWLFDVAHNLPGIRAVLRALDALQAPRPTVGVVGILGDKDWRGMTFALASQLDEIVLTNPPSAPASRRWDPHQAARWLRARDVSARVRVVSRFDHALDRVSGEEWSTIVVTGSCHTVGDAYLHLGVEPFPTTPVTAGAVADVSSPVDFP